MQYANKIVLVRLPEVSSSRRSTDSEELLINNEEEEEEGKKDIDDDRIDKDGSVDDAPAVDRGNGTITTSRTRPSHSASNTNLDTGIEISSSDYSEKHDQDSGKLTITSLWAVATAFAILAFTAGIGIVITGM